MNTKNVKQLRVALLDLIGLCNGASQLANLPIMRRAQLLLSDEPKHENTIALCMSTEHIERGTAENLEDSAVSGGAVWANEHGAFVFVPEPDEEDEHREPDLMAVFAYARKYGYEWVRFDSDGPKLDGLPVYEWA